MVGRLAAWIMPILLLTTISLGFYLLVKQRAMFAWPTVTGQITDVRFIETTNAPRTKWITTYRPVVEFRYHVQGLRYIGNRLTPYEADEIPFYDRKAYDRAAADLGHSLRRGDSIEVSYNPNDSQQSYLFRRPASIPVFLSIIPALPIVIWLMYFLCPPSPASRGFWGSIWWFISNRKGVWASMRIGLTLYPAICILILGLEYAFSRMGVVGFALLAHYLLLASLPTFAKFARAPLPARRKPKLVE
jgi:hypothetical protein